MTAAAIDRRTLAESLAHLADVGAQLPPRDLALRLARAARTAAIQADEIAMLRAQAADRERARGVLGAVLAEVDRLEVTLTEQCRRPATALVSAQWAAKRIRDAIASTPIENPEEFQHA